MNINEMVEQAHATAVDKGWWGEPRNLPTQIALMHSELSEALEAYRDGEPDYHWSADEKPEGIVAELADVLIRVADTCGRYGWDLERAVVEKMRYNESRPHRHGGKVC